jgi:hypothetical protein
MLQWTEFFTKLGFNYPTSSLISKNELQSIKLGLKISNYERLACKLYYIYNRYAYLQFIKNLKN